MAAKFRAAKGMEDKTELGLILFSALPTPAMQTDSKRSQI